jgi:hypothetical protein
MEPMTVQAEVWPVAADRTGLWLISGDDAWRSDAVMADGDVHFEVEMLLHEHEIGDADIAAIHSTSWRPDGPAVVLTYMAVIRPRGAVRERWPHALPVTADLAEAAGKPPTHAATDPPVPRYLDVLLHGLRHLHHLMLNDRTNADAMGDLWRQHLVPFEPALAGMYSEPHQAA